LARDERRAVLARDERVGLAVEAQFPLPLRVVGSVARVAVLREDRLHVAREVDRRRRRFGWRDTVVLGGDRRGERDHDEQAAGGRHGGRESSRCPTSGRAR
jgi:hypothetical protein